MKFERLPEFDSDVKFLLKRFRTLQEDLQIVEKVLTVLPEERPPFSVRIDHLGLKTCVIKVRKMACKALKGRGVQSGLRLIYAYFQEEETIVWVELYYKGDQETERRDRILRYFE